MQRGLGQDDMSTTFLRFNNMSSGFELAGFLPTPRGARQDDSSFRERTFSISNHIDPVPSHISPDHGISDDADSPITMMFSCVDR